MARGLFAERGFDAIKAQKGMFSYTGLSPAEATRLREEAQRTLAEYQRKHQDAVTEAEAIIAQARANGVGVTAEGVERVEQIAEVRSHAESAGREVKIGLNGFVILEDTEKEAKERLLDAFEKSYVAQLLERAGGNVSRAADEAGIDRNHLARLAKKHGIR